MTIKSDLIPFWWPTWQSAVGPCKNNFSYTADTSNTTLKNREMQSEMISRQLSEWPIYPNSNWSICMLLWRQILCNDEYIRKVFELLPLNTEGITWNITTKFLYIDKMFVTSLYCISEQHLNFCAYSEMERPLQKTYTSKIHLHLAISIPNFVAFALELPFNKAHRI